MTYIIHLMAWIQWDPQRVAFTVPFIQRDVAWYGVFFALGFFLGFFLLVSIFRRKLFENKQILERDIQNWSLLTTQLKKNNDPRLAIIFGKLSEKTQKAIKQFHIGQEPDDLQKKEILRALTCAMIDSKLQLKRSEIENLLPKSICTIREQALFLTDRMTWFVVAGTIIGARLGHVFLYDWPRYQKDYLGIIKIWEGGLASHGGTIGIMLALVFYLKMIHKRYPEFKFINILDILCIPTAMAAIWIRIGNFFNQEILGPVTTVPWAVVFHHPYDGSAPLPRHPAQLYEAAAYLIVFIFLYTLWKKKAEKLKPGLLIGLFMVSIFGSRFLIEFVKSPQSLLFDESLSLLSTGQYLSIPFVFLGLSFLLYSKKHKKAALNN